MKIMDFTSTRLHKGVYPDWRVVLLTLGDRYGRGGVFEVGVPEREGQDPKWANKSRVDFYWYFPGFEHDFQGGPDYQFVSGYYLSTILGLDNLSTKGPLRLARTGLDLVGYEPAWKLSDQDMVRVLAWLLNVLPEGDPDVSEELREELLVELDVILEEMDVPRSNPRHRR